MILKRYNWLLSFLDLGHSLSALDSFSNQKYVEKGPLAEESASSEISVVSIPILHFHSESVDSLQMVLP